MLVSFIYKHRLKEKEIQGYQSWTLSQYLLFNSLLTDKKLI